MPERFLLQLMTEDGSWMDEAVCLRRRFERLEDGSYICSEFSSGSGFAASPITTATSST
jgi:hypothetical protein